MLVPYLHFSMSSTVRRSKSLANKVLGMIDTGELYQRSWRRKEEFTSPAKQFVTTRGSAKSGKYRDGESFLRCHFSAVAVAATEGKWAFEL